jgi:surface protein
MASMFQNAASFNQPLDKWDVSKVKDMNSMFLAAAAFNQNIGSWNVASVSNMKSMFNEAAYFNQDISAWNVARVANLAGRAAPFAAQQRFIPAMQKRPSPPLFGACPRPSAVWMQTRLWRRAWTIAS